MKIDVNKIIEKLTAVIADLQLQVAILQAEKEEMQNRTDDKKK